MNRERAKELLPIIQAYADGKIIQLYVVDGDWVDTYSPSFTGKEYRIKPEPRIIYVNERMGDLMGVNWDTEKEAYSGDDDAKIVKFIEVIE